MKTRLVILAALAVAVAFVPACLRATAAQPAAQAAILHQEARWLAAIESGDRATIDSLLSANYKHIDDSGKMYDRAQELAAVKKESFKMVWSNETFDFAGDVAVVHGLNALTQPGKAAEHFRYTDVYVKQNGTWVALSAQETAIQ